MRRLTVLDACDQASISAAPYDRWISPDGDVLAEFYRDGAKVLMRFSGEADFIIDPETGSVRARPAPDIEATHVAKLFNNSVIPTLGNHTGGLFLHGSAVVLRDGAVAFLGQSRSGKTTLAAAFAKAGHRFVTEDVIDLYRAGKVDLIRPKPSALRLFPDSAENLFGDEHRPPEQSGKVAIEPGAELTIATQPLPLKTIYLLGSDHEARLAIQPVARAEALTALMQHAFVLDVEDRARMRAHFNRLADLVERIPVRRLDYPRSYSALPQVQSAITDDQSGIS